MLRGGEELLADLSAKLEREARPHDGRRQRVAGICRVPGACEGAPCMLVNDECHMNMTDETAAAVGR